jgi:alpha-beta hydrolase superfamily lysophospholipase
VHNKITSSLIYNLMRRAAWLRDYRAELPIPTLLYHGTDDRLTSHPASKAFAAQVSGPITFVEFPGFYHEIHNEPEQEQLFEQIHSWLNGVLG